MLTYFGVDDYAQPQWSGVPSATYFFEIVKDGSQIGTINIRKKKFHLIGKLQDLCDIPIDNPTVSRKHAILQFKQNQLTPYMYDLGSTHGTRINRKELPPRVYQKLAPFDTIKFGQSSRMYIFRCLQLEQNIENQEQEADKNFANLLEQQHIKLSKQELKEKYIALLENDPYHRGQNQGRKLIGHSNEKNNDEMGVDWGITDENQIYAYRNQHEFVLEPDLLRRLPGLDGIQLNKISQFQTCFNKYQEVEAELNELNKKEKQQFGLQEKSRAKKEKLQKKFMEVLEAVQKNQSWIRSTIFGQQDQQAIPRDTREKELDTFQDDQFMDRTLGDKSKLSNPHAVSNDPVTTLNYWQIKKILESKIIRKGQLMRIKEGRNLMISKDNEGQEDQLQAFMKQNNEKLVQQTQKLEQMQIQSLQTEIRQMQNQLSLQQKDLQKIQQKLLGKKQENDDEEEKIKELQIKTMNTSKVMKELERKQRQKSELNEEDPQIFKYYQNQAKLQEFEETHKRKRVQVKDDEVYQRPIVKYPKLQVKRDKTDLEEEVYIDLTKIKK